MAAVDEMKWHIVKEILSMNETRIIARIQPKGRADQAFYRMLGSDGKTIYTVEVLDGIAQECECKSFSYRKTCKHCTAATAHERERNHHTAEEAQEAPQTVEKAPQSYGWDIPPSPLGTPAQIAEVAKKQDRLVSSSERALSAFGLMHGQSERRGGWLSGAAK